MRMTRLAFGGTLAALLAGCSGGTETGGENLSAMNDIAPIATAAAPTGNEVCGADATYRSVKDQVFDAAAKSVGGDLGPLNALRNAVGVRMELPIVQAVDEKLQRTDCAGRLVLSLPPGVSSAFDGESAIAADVTYSVQPAADGNGTVVTARGTDDLVQRLILANGERVSRGANVEGVAADASRAASPSFSCSGRINAVERMICQDEGLAARDRELSAAFKQRLAQASGGERNTLLSNQRALLGVRAGCQDVQCISDWYDSALSDYQ